MKSRRPEPYLDSEQYELQAQSIFHADVYYDVTDNDTHIVPRIMTHNNDHQTGIWIRASSVFKNNSKGEADVRIHNADLSSQ